MKLRKRSKNRTLDDVDTLLKGYLYNAGRDDNRERYHIDSDRDVSVGGWQDVEEERLVEFL